jgi:hypothetical protein
MKINLNGKKFKALTNSENGEVGAETIFVYRQNNDIIYAEYYGGDILKGQLFGKFVNDEFSYQHLNTAKEIMTGKCKSYPETGNDGKIILNEIWQWTCKDNSSGTSKLKEI